MAVCNLFNVLENKTGTFFTFSQYTEDLTRNISQRSNYKIVPSKFYALYIDFSQEDNISIPKKLRDRFENGCAICRSKLEESWTPELSKNLFWNALLGVDGITEGMTDISSFKYYGDINFQSYSEYDGMGYSEIYCYLSNNDKSYIFEHGNSQSSEISLSSNTTIEGYSSEELAGCLINAECESNIYLPFITHDFKRSSEEDVDFFKINTIIPLYSIYSGDNILYEDIPLGIFFTGIIDENHMMTNEITKYIHNIDIYDSGTSYGLRICSRYVISGQDYIYEMDTNVEGGYNSDLCKLLEKMAETHNKMDEILSKNYVLTQNYKELLSIFKNSKTNVPYIKNVGGVDYWFVNGKVVGETNNNSSNICDCLTLNTEWESSGILSILEDAPSVMNLNWELKKGDIVITPEELYINNTQVALENPLQITLPSEKSSYIGFNLKAVYKDEEIIATPYISYVYPSYIGLGNSYEEVVHENNMRLLENHNTIYNYSNESQKHVYYIYPASYGPLKSIRDSRDLDYINDFEYQNMDIHGVSYYIYVDKTVANVVNYTLKFR